ncbi:MAG: fructose-bisphosphatase class III [Ruthenibacterium lactatiformans]
MYSGVTTTCSDGRGGRQHGGCQRHPCDASYNNLETLEDGYGISLRPLSQYAEEVYRTRTFPALAQAGRGGRVYPG